MRATTPARELSSMIGSERERKVIRSEDMPEDMLELIAIAEVPARYAHLDEEIGDWRP